MSASRLPFLLAVAIIAAGVADPVVETVSNAGVFGAGFSDNNHLGVVPTLLAGAIIAMEMLVLRCIAVLQRSSLVSPQTLVDVAKEIGRGSAARDFPVIFVLQLAALFALENTEALVTGGRLVGGTTWFGGPILFSLAAHALIGLFCRLALGACMRAFVRTFASLVDTVVRIIWLAIAGPSGAAFRIDRHSAESARAQAPHVREIGGRAPPRFQTLVLTLA